MAVPNNGMLPARWYIHNVHEEVRMYLQATHGHGTGKFWEGYTYIGYVAEESTSHQGVFACGSESSMERKRATKLTIEEFKKAFKKDEIINDYPIY